MRQVIVFIDGKITRLNDVASMRRYAGIIEFTDNVGDVVAEFAEDAISGWKISNESATS